MHACLLCILGMSNKSLLQVCLHVTKQGNADQCHSSFMSFHIAGSSWHLKTALPLQAAHRHKQIYKNCLAKKQRLTAWTAQRVQQ